MKRIVQALLVVGLWLMLWTPAAACSPNPFTVNVTCPDGTVVRVYERDDVLAKLPEQCRLAIEPEVQQFILQWQERRKDFFLETNVYLEPWQADREATLLQQEQALTPCIYRNWSRIGSWLVSEDKPRTYCHVDTFSIGSCGSIRSSPFEFLGFALVHPSRATLPYLLAAGAVIGFLGLLGFRGHKQHRLGKLLTPPLSLVLGLVPFWIATVCVWGASLSDVVGLAILFYILAAIIAWPLDTSQL